MPSITIHPTPSKTPLTAPSSSFPTNPLPQLLQTPSGLAICEIQGTLNLPSSSDPDTDPTGSNTATNKDTQVGRLVFPLYDATAKDDSAWMKQVYLFVGKHQRMTGEVRKLAKPMAILRKRGGGEGNGEGEEEEEELEVAEIVRFKVLFASRPEPVGGEVA